MITDANETGPMRHETTETPVVGISETGAVSHLALLAADVAAEKLGLDTVVLAMGELLGVLDAFVITSGRNLRHVRTIVEEIEKRVKQDGGPSPASIEGMREGVWVLMDYGDFVVHVFSEEGRSYFDLEHLWSKAPRVKRPLANEPAGRLG